MHSLPRHQEEVINDMLREYKKQKAEELHITVSSFDITDKGIEVNEGQQLMFDFDSPDYMIVPVFNNTEQDILRLEEERCKQTKKQQRKTARAKLKQDLIKKLKHLGDLDDQR